MTDHALDPALHVLGSVHLDAVTAHNPIKFCQNHPGITVSGEIIDHLRFPSRRHKVEDFEATTLTIYELTREAWDAHHIIPQLGEKYAFSVSEITARIKQLISRQPHGEIGDLCVSGNANVFYSSGRGVSLRWRIDAKEWWMLPMTQNHYGQWLGPGWPKYTRIFSASEAP